MRHPDRIKPNNKVVSISRRFSYGLIGVVTLLLIMFAVVGIFINVQLMERDLMARLDNAVRLAQTSLPTPLWNLDRNVVNDFIEALFLDEAIVYTKISAEDEDVTIKIRPGWQDLNPEAAATSTARGQSELLHRSAVIRFEDNPVGEIRIVVSRKSLKEKALVQIYGIIALAIVLIAVIWLTTVVITRRYISEPLLQLQQSASRIARGDLDTFVDISGTGEIGVLAHHLDGMRGSIKQLFGALNDSKARLEEYSRTLEQKVAERTGELARTVEELRALGEVSRTVSSTLDIETVLSHIVR
nr:HAMP domain-containing protein [Desulfobacterales bacterium]